MAYNITSSINTKDTCIQCIKSILQLSQCIKYHKYAHIYNVVASLCFLEDDVKLVLG